MAVSSIVKSIQNIMRQDTGVDGDAQRIGQLGTVNLMAAGERLSPIAFVKRPLLLPAIPPWLRCEIGEASGGKSGGAGR